MSANITTPCHTQAASSFVQPLTRVYVFTPAYVFECGVGGGLSERLAGLAGCCIIFGRVVPSLWRASVKSDACHHPPLSPHPSPTFSGSGSRAKPGSGGSLAAAVAQNAAGPAGPYTAQTPRALHTERRWPDHLLALITAGVQQVDQRAAPLAGCAHLKG